MRRKISFLLVIVLLLSLLCGCRKNETPEVTDTVSPEVSNVRTYDSQVITIEGAGVKSLKISVSELRALPQHKLDASYQRTTGLTEEFVMEGPYLSDVFSYLGLDLSAYAGLGVQGRDGYYCLLNEEIIAQTPDLMLALTIDGAAELPENDAPARLAAQGQYGPYWVRMVEKITLFDEIPEKEIKSVWVFANLAEGIEPYEYEYYGSKDAAIDLEQIFSRFDSVNTEAFFTMKSSDGYKKDETINIVKSRYYIKIEGEDAPTNVSPYIKLGMNVNNIAWISTNADAAFFPEQLEIYMDLKEIDGKTGVPLSEILFETGVEKVSGVSFDIFGTNGEKITVSGDDLTKGILVTNGDGTYSVFWDKTLKLDNVPNLMRIRVSPADAEESPSDTPVTDTPSPEVSSGNDDDLNTNESPNNDDNSNNGDTNTETPPTPPSPPPTENKNVVLTIRGNGVEKMTTWSIEELKALASGAGTTTYSMVNNWPTKKIWYAKGVPIMTLMAAAGVKSGAATFKVTASDGYAMSFTRNQFLENHMYYPNVATGSTAGGTRVSTLLSWAWWEKGENEPTKQNLRIMFGQRGINDVNTDASVKDVIVIDVSTTASATWGSPTPSISPGAVSSGTEVALNHDYLNRTKIYYTLDGSVPTNSSTVYNPSTTNFQPELIKPIKITSDTTIRVLVTGWGRHDSRIFEFRYTVK